MEVRTFLSYPPPELPVSVLHRVGGALGLAEHRHFLGAVRLYKVVEGVEERFHFWHIVLKNVPPQTLDEGGRERGCCRLCIAAGTLSAEVRYEPRHFG